MTLGKLEHVGVGKGSEKGKAEFKGEADTVPYRPALKTMLPLTPTHYQGFSLQ